MDRRPPEPPTDWRAEARRAWVAARPLVDVVLLRPLALLLTVLLLFEEWGWQLLLRVTAGLTRWRPLAKIERTIADLPPYGALATFVLPAVLLIPIKLAAVWLLAHGEPFAAVAILIAAKLVGTGLVAHIYVLTKPQLMHIGWFARGYAVFMPWKEATFARVRATWAWRWGRVMKAAAKHRLHRLWAWARSG